MRRALAIDKASYGTNHPDVARDLNNLAHLLHSSDRLGEAEPLMRRALAIDEASYGTDHPKVALNVNNLVSLLHNTNRLAEAERRAGLDALYRAAAVAVELLGPVEALGCADAKADTGAGRCRSGPQDDRMVHEFLVAPEVEDARCFRFDVEADQVDPPRGRPQHQPDDGGVYARGLRLDSRNSER